MRQLRVLKTRVEALPLAPYCVLAGMVAAIGSVALVGLAIFVAQAAGFRFVPSDAIGSPDITDAFGTIFFAPVVETLLRLDA